MIEDEYFIAKELEALLQSRGANVVGPIGNMDDAIAQVRRDGFEVAVIDINLQGIECYVVADELKRHDVPFIFASAYSEDRIPERFDNVHLWQKPYNESALVEDVRRLCEGLPSK